MIDGNLFRFQNGFLKWRSLFSNLYTFVVDLKLRDVYGRYKITFLYTVRVKAIKTVYASKIHFAVFCLQTHVGLERIRLDAVVEAIISALPGHRVELGKSLVGAKPNIAIFVAQ